MIIILFSASSEYINVLLLLRSKKSIVLFCSLCMITSRQWNICLFLFPINLSEPLIKFTLTKQSMIFKICYDHNHGSKIFVILNQNIFDYTFFISNQVAKSWGSNLVQKLSNYLAILKKLKWKKMKELNLNFRKFLPFYGKRHSNF